MQEYQEIIQKLKDFMEKTGRKQSEICRTIDISSSAVSQFLSGQYQGDNAGLAEKIRKYIAQEEIKGYMVKLPAFKMTTAAKEVFFAASYARNHNCMSLVYGRAGVGKTMAIKEYMKQNVGIVYVAIHGSDNTKAVYERILTSIGKKVNGNTARLLDMIISTLANTNRLLIIDEAQHLSAKTFNSLRSLNDEGNIPVMFAGSPEVYDTVQEEKYLDQISSRIFPKREIKDNPNVSDIALIFEDYNFNRKCIEALYTKACNPGALRHMMAVYQMALSSAMSVGETFNEKHIAIGSKHADSRR